MNLSLLDVKQVFNDLLSRKISREQAEHWAELRMNAFDAGELTFEPCSDQELLWEAVIYLSGVAMKISPDEYMENEEGIRIEFGSKWDK